MSTSGRGTGYLFPQAGKLHMLGGEAPKTGAALTAGSLRLYPVFLPFAVPYTALGFNITAAGAAGCTIVPAIYQLDAFGGAKTLIIAGTAVPADAIAQANVAQAGVLPAGRLWAGGLCLSGGAVPTVTSVSTSDQDSRGSLVPTDNAIGAVALGFQSGLAALPATFAGTYQAGAAPMLYVTT